MNRKLLGAIIFAVIGLFIIFFKPFADLGGLGHEILGIVLIALGLWVFKPGNVPLLAGGSVVVFGSLAILFAHKESMVNVVTGNPYTSGELYGVVANGFVSSAVWTLIPALYFGFVLQKTGLGKRLAYMVLKAFNPSWASMAVSWLIIGVVLSALTPSITVRIAIVIPIAISIVEACKLEPRSRGAAFVTLLAWGMCVFPGTGWLTGSLCGPIMQGFLPADMKVFATNGEWLRILCLPWMIVTILYAGLSYVFTKPNQPIGIDVETFKEEYRKLGAMTRNETVVLVTLLACLVLFFTESIHGIPTPATAMGALFIFIMARIIEGPELNTGINWDVVLFFGVTIGLSQIFRFSQITSWFEPIIKPSISSLAPNPLLFMLVITLGLMIIRFLDVPWAFTTIALTASLTSMLFTDFGYHPLAVTMAFLIAINFFLLSYQQPWILMADGMIQGRGWSENHVMLFGSIYIFSALVAVVIAIPYWHSLGGIIP